MFDMESQPTIVKSVVESTNSGIESVDSTADSAIREDVKIPTYKPHTNHKRSSVRSHTLAPTSICDLSHSLCWRPLTDLGHLSSVTYVCHPLWFVRGLRKGILTSPLIPLKISLWVWALRQRYRSSRWGGARWLDKCTDRGGVSKCRPMS